MNDPYFEPPTHQNMFVFFQNRGQMGSRYIVRSDRWIFGVYQPHTGRSVPGEQIPVSTYEVNTELNAPPVPGDVPGDGRFWSSSCCGGGRCNSYSHLDLHRFKRGDFARFGRVPGRQQRGIATRRGWIANEPMRLAGGSPVMVAERSESE